MMPFLIRAIIALKQLPLWGRAPNWNVAWRNKAVLLSKATLVRIGPSGEKPTIQVWKEVAEKIDL